MNVLKRPMPTGEPVVAAHDDVAAESERWIREAFAPAAGKPERRRFVTDVGIPVEPLYTPADLDRIGFDYLRDLGFPGEYPFTRGDRPGKPRSRR